MRQKRSFALSKQQGSSRWIKRSFTPLSSSWLDEALSFISNGKSSTAATSTTTNEGKRLVLRDELLDSLSNTPRGAVTPYQLTQQILFVVEESESDCCPSEDGTVLYKLAGNWELLWTAQDRKTVATRNDDDDDGYMANKLPWWKGGGTGTWINPIENQAYSNNPTGRNNDSNNNRRNNNGNNNNKKKMNVKISSSSSPLHCNATSNSNCSSRTSNSSNKKELLNG